MGEQRQRHLLHVGPQLRLQQAQFGNLGARQRFVVGAGFGLGRGRDERGGQRLVLAEAIGQMVSVKHTLAFGVAPPQRRARHAGDVASHHDLDRERSGRDGDERVGIGLGEGVVGDNVAARGEPPTRELVEHLALQRHGRDNTIEGGKPIGGDEQHLIIRQLVGDAHLADAATRKRQLDVAEGIGRKRLTHVVSLA